MKKVILLLHVISLAAYSFAQTALPYYTGFETTAERAGWAQFTKGNKTTELWTLGSWSSLSTSPNLLVSPSAEFNSSALTDTINQWYVSPGFNFSAGGKIDSMSIAVFGASGSTQPTDSIVVYLLRGSNNPSLATSKTRLANLTTMVQGFGLTMRDTGNFIIPPTSGTSYIAFKYYGIYDWYQVYIDSIYISGNPTAGSNSYVPAGETISIYPNPANTEVNIVLPGNITEGVTVTVLDVVGRCVLDQRFEPASQPPRIDISNIPPGLYCIKVNTGRNEVFKKLLVTH